MTNNTAKAIEAILNARSQLSDLCHFFENLTKKEGLPANVRSSSENALFELVDRYADLDMYFRYLMSLEPDLCPRPYKEF